MKEGYIVHDIDLTAPKPTSSTYTCILFKPFISFKHNIASTCREKDEREGQRKNIYAVDKIFQFNEDYYNFGLILNKGMNFNVQVTHSTEF